MTGDRGLLRAYSALLGLYPRQFRDEYGADMVQLVRDQCTDEPAWKVGGRAAIDLALTIPTRHLEAHMNRTPNHLVPLIYTALAAAGGLLAIVGGTNLTMLITGLCVAVAATTMAVIAWRQAAPIRTTIATGGWWKLIAAGPCILIVVIVAAGVGVEAWELGILAVFFAFVLTGTGLLLGLVRLANRRRTTMPT